MTFVLNFPLKKTFFDGYMVDIYCVEEYNYNNKLKGKPVEMQGRKAKGLR